MEEVKKQSYTVKGLGAQMQPKERENRGKGKNMDQ